MNGKQTYSPSKRINYVVFIPVYGSRVYPSGIPASVSDSTKGTVSQMRLYTVMLHKYGILWSVYDVYAPNLLAAENEAIKQYYNDGADCYDVTATAQLKYEAAMEKEYECV